MRKKLKSLEAIRSTFIGTFCRAGMKVDFGHPKRTLLLTNVKDSTGKIITDHLWFNYTKGFATLNLVPGDTVQFDARVKAYVKGYQGYREDIFDKPVELDYLLSHPTKLKKLQCVLINDQLNLFA